MKAIAMDMWEAYASLLRAIVDDADDKIVFDRFHIVAHMNDAVDKIRRRENKQLRAAADDRLVGSKHLWLYGRENLPDDYPVEVRMEFSRLRDSNLKTARAWALRESLRELWDQRSRVAGERWWESWYAWAIRSQLEPVKKVARMIKRHLSGVLSYSEHRITNRQRSDQLGRADAQEASLRLPELRELRTAMLFRCGGLHLYPTSHLKAG